MTCSKCNTQMEIGKAIKSNRTAGAIYFYPPVNITAETLQMIYCLKCPSCGYSVDLKSTDIVQDYVTGEIRRRPKVASFVPRNVQVTSEFLANYKKSIGVNTELPADIVDFE